MQISFFGAASTVTGSRYLLSYHSKKILIDCGLFQGYKELRLRNWDRFPIKPRDIDAVILTHAHIDHSGYLPLLVKHGFKGHIYCTPGTFELCEILLPDSAYLQEEEARLANRQGFSKHHPALPLYTVEDATKALTHFKTIPFETKCRLFDHFTFHFSCAGHIIGASMVQVNTDTTTILFSGDMGRPHDPIMQEPATIKQTDYLVIESTYGDRLHATTNPQEQLGQVINQTFQRGGSIIMPAFAVGRAQSMLYYIDQLKKAGTIPNIPVFLDSPMAISATNILHHHQAEFRLSKEESDELCRGATYVNDPEDSKLLDLQKFPKIIISASGMAEGGRILYHLKAYAPEAQHTILFTGYQAGGTRGAKIIAGDPTIKIHGEWIPMNAQIEVLSSASSHADYSETLAWLAKFSRPPKKTFITHGEIDAAKSLKEKIEEQLHWLCEIPTYLQKETL